jgi:Cell Wall Hydrolase
MGRAATMILAAAMILAWQSGQARAGEGAPAARHPAFTARVPAPTGEVPSDVLTGTPAPPLVPGPAHPRVAVSLTPADQEAMGRVAFAEAGDQGAEGLAGVIFTILNRLHGGPWGATVTAVVDAPGQFEPVMRAGGTWTKLPALTPAQRVEYETILHLILDGRLPDPTNGALYFQNPTIVAERAAAGAVPPALVNFGGQRPSATIGGQTFYRRVAPGVASGGRTTRPVPPSLFAAGGAQRLFVPAEGRGATPAGLFVPVAQDHGATAPSLPAGLSGRALPLSAPVPPPGGPAGSLPTGPEASAP